jgi:hypothetical protein
MPKKLYNFINSKFEHIFYANTRLKQKWKPDKRLMGAKACLVLKYIKPVYAFVFIKNINWKHGIVDVFQIIIYSNFVRTWKLEIYIRYKLLVKNKTQYIRLSAGNVLLFDVRYILFSLKSKPIFTEAIFVIHPQNTSSVWAFFKIGFCRTGEW